MQLDNRKGANFEMKKAVVFPGQGAQKPGMFMDLYESYDVVKTVFDQASQIIGNDLAQLCREGSREEMSLTVNSQPLILACGIAAWELYKMQNGRPEYLAGYSLGEYAALYAAGCISFTDVFKIIKIRAQAMQEAVPRGVGGMAAVIFSDEKKVTDYFHQNHRQVWIANYNTKGQVSIAGKIGDVQIACKELDALGIITKQLPVSAPFHCRLLEDAKIRIAEEIHRVSLMDAAVPVVTNVDGEAETDANAIRRKMVEQVVSPVQWIKTMDYLSDNGVTSFTECGPGHTLSNFIRKMRYGNIHQHNIEDLDSLRKALAA
ncbi:MAG: ACP S-malonyltransferase [Anaerovoracaceae bacterium]|jgi:[acyl-carrier-protein] S-malonyltransferase